MNRRGPGSTATVGRSERGCPVHAIQRVQKLLNPHYAGAKPRLRNRRRYPRAFPSWRWRPRRNGLGMEAGMEALIVVGPAVALGLGLLGIDALLSRRRDRKRDFLP
jgi:hypothetical protein